MSRNVKSLLTSLCQREGMVRQAHHDICHPELAEVWQRGERPMARSQRLIEGDFLINVNSILRLIEPISK